MARNRAVLAYIPLHSQASVERTEWQEGDVQKEGPAFKAPSNVLVIEISLINNLKVLQ